MRKSTELWPVASTGGQSRQSTTCYILNTVLNFTNGINRDNSGRLEATSDLELAAPEDLRESRLPSKCGMRIQLRRDLDI